MAYMVYTTFGHQSQLPKLGCRPSWVLGVLNSHLSGVGVFVGVGVSLVWLCGRKLMLLFDRKRVMLCVRSLMLLFARKLVFRDVGNLLTD